MGFYNVDIFNENGMQAFYVRPFSEEIKRDLDRLMADTVKMKSSVSITEKNGTYRISTKELYSVQSFMEGLWGMLFRRFLAESKHVCVDPITEERYYVLIFSAEFIEPCERKIVA